MEPAATEFLRELVKNYLHLVHKDELEPVNYQISYLTVKDQEDDSFSRYYDPDFPRKKKKKIKAFQIKKNGKDTKNCKSMRRLCR